jgi:uncharacterized protein (DUF1015 family)
MAKIYPFRGIRYNPDVVKSLDAVVTQPFDRIDSALQDEYYGRNELNFVRLNRGKTAPGDTGSENPYTRAAGFLEAWLRNGVLRRDEKPSLYICHIEYRLPGDHFKTWRGFLTLVQLEELGKGIRPHEKTLARPKQDRLDLMRATGAQLEPVFLLYDDSGDEIQKRLDDAEKEGAGFSACDDDGNLHKVWAVTDHRVIEGVSRLMEGKPLIIGDGHHRYETSLEYRDEMRGKGVQCEGNENYNNILAALANARDEGVTILPTHRAVSHIPDFDEDSVFTRISKTFLIEEIPHGRRKEDALHELLERMEKLKKRHSFGLYLRGGSTFHLVTLGKEESIEPFMKGGHSQVWKRLDVSILHGILIEKILGIGPEQIEKGMRIHYLRGAEEAVSLVDQGKYGMVFLLNPTDVDHVRAVVAAGECMPVRSTDFYPKVLSGLVMNKLNIVR